MNFAGGLRAPNLRHRLISLVGAVAVPFVLLSGMVIWSAYRDDRARTEERLQEQARALALVVDREFARAEAVLSTLAASPLLLHGDIATFEDDVRAASKILRNSVVVLMDRDRHLLVDTNWPRGEHHPERQGPPAMREALASGHMAISNLYRGTSGKLLVAVGVAAPLLPPTPDTPSVPPPAYVPTYILGAGLQPSLFGAALSEQRLPEGWVGGVIDRSDHVVWRSAMADTYVGTETTAVTRAAMAHADGGVFRGMRVDGVDSVFAFARAPESRFVVVLGVPNAVLAAPLRVALWRTLLVGVVVAGSGFGIALLMGRSIAAGIQGLAAGGGGVAALRASGTLREVRDVAERLVRISAERDEAEGALRALAGRLEDEVAARTAALAQNEARLRGIFDAQFQFISLLAPDGTRLEMNAAALKFGGQPAEAVIGRKWWDVDWWRGDPERTAMMRNVVARAAAGEFVRYESSATGADGSPVTIDVSIKPIIDPVSGAIAMLIAEGRDVTELRRLEARLAQASRLEALGQLAGGIAHDFNNVLQAVSGGIALIARRADDPAAVARLSRMVSDAAERGSAITRRLLGFARRDELRAVPIDAGALLTNMQEVLRYTLGAGIEVAVSAPDALPAMLADRAQLEAVLVNLATNARDAMPQGGRLTFAAASEIRAEASVSPPLRPGAYVRLSAGDTGRGMDAAILARAMEPFFTTKEVGKGTGLGLAMARGFAEQSGGALDIASTLGEGTTVTLWLPQAEPAAPAAACAPRRDDAPDGCRLLLVEDEPAVRQTLASELSGFGYHVSLAQDGPAALALLQGGQPIDLLVADLAMPGMSGLDLIRAAQAQFPCLPAILLTGYAGEAASLAVGGALSGAFTLLRKPVSAAHLADRVAALMERRRTPAG